MRATWIARVVRHSIKLFGGALGWAANALAIITILTLPTVALLDLIPGWVPAFVLPAVIGIFGLAGASRVAAEDRSTIKSLTLQLLAAQRQRTPQRPLPQPTLTATPGTSVLRDVTVRDNGADGIRIGRGTSIDAGNVTVEGNGGSGVVFD